MQAQWTRNLGKIGGPEAGRRAVARYSNAANKARARGEKPGEAEAALPPLVGAPPAAAGGARGGGGGGGLAGGEGAGVGGLTRPEERRRAWPMRLRASGRRRRRRAGRGERGFAGCRPPRVSFGRRFWARRVGFSARCNYLRPQIMDNANARRVARLTQHATPFPSAFTMCSAIL